MREPIYYDLMALIKTKKVGKNSRFPTKTDRNRNKDGPFRTPSVKKHKISLFH